MVDVRNLQSLTSTQESSTVEPAKDDDDYVFRVPASPELPNPGTDMINTVTTSIMNAKTVPCSSNLEETTIQELNKNGKRLTSNSNTCKLNESTTEVVSSKKRRRDDGDINALSVNTKKVRQQYNFTNIMYQVSKHIIVVQYLETLSITCRSP